MCYRVVHAPLSNHLDPLQAQAPLTLGMAYLVDLPNSTTVAIHAVYGSPTRSSSQCTSGKHGSGLVDLPDIKPGHGLRRMQRQVPDRQSKEESHLEIFPSSFYRQTYRIARLGAKLSLIPAWLFSAHPSIHLDITTWVFLSWTLIGR